MSALTAAFGGKADDICSVRIVAIKKRQHQESLVEEEVKHATFARTIRAAILALTPTDIHI